MSLNQYEKYHICDHIDKKGTCYNKQEIDNQTAALKTEITTLIQSSIQTALIKYHTNLLKKINNCIKGRVGKKTLTIPKTNQTWIKLFDVSEIEGVTSLQDVLIQDIYIKRSDRYHHAKSDLVASSFNQLEIFYDKDFKKYFCYFNSHPSDWLMDCFFSYVKTPKEINIEDSDEEVDE